MIVFPNCKINLGLYITHKRVDGYHDLNTLFYPVHHLFDSLEIVTAKQTSFTCSGNSLEIPEDKNIVLKAYQLLRNDFDLPPVAIHLHKNIPHGAGLGGGSADASFMINLCNDFFQLDLNIEKRLNLALQLGSDCPFFIYNSSCIAKGRGELLQPITFSLSQYKIVLVKPSIHISTVDAFQGITVENRNIDIEKIIRQPIDTWKHILHNQFEETISTKHIILQKIKNSMYNLGAHYASLTGTGSVVYGIFPKQFSGTNQLEPFGQVYE